jgi:hypothetical protein
LGVVGSCRQGAVGSCRRACAIAPSQASCAPSRVVPSGKFNRQVRARATGFADGGSWRPSRPCGQAHRRPGRAPSPPPRPAHAPAAEDRTTGRWARPPTLAPDSRRRRESVGSGAPRPPAASGAGPGADRAAELPPRPDRGPPPLDRLRPGIAFRMVTRLGVQAVQGLQCGIGAGRVARASTWRGRNGSTPLRSGHRRMGVCSRHRISSSRCAPS